MEQWFYFLHFDVENPSLEIIGQPDVNIVSG